MEHKAAPSLPLFRRMSDTPDQVCGHSAPPLSSIGRMDGGKLKHFSSVLPFQPICLQFINHLHFTKRNPPRFIAWEDDAERMGESLIN